MGFAGQLFDKKGEGSFTQENLSKIQKGERGVIAKDDNKEPIAVNKNLSKDSATTDGTPKSSAPLRYPYAKIDEHDDYMRLEIVAFTPPGLVRAEDSLRLRTSDEIAKKDINYTILLPVPQGVQDTRSADWGMSEMGPLGALAASAAATGLESDGSLASMAGATLSELSSQFQALTDPANRSTTSNLLTGGISALVANAITGGATDAEETITRQTGLRINKNQQLLFQGVTGREFGFTWDIVPRNKKEAEQVKAIIRIFKQSMAPQRGGAATVKGLFLKSPDIFYLTYMKGKEQHPFLHAFKPCAMTGCNVNYTGSGNYSTYYDGNPIHLNLSLTFSELTPIFREDYLSEAAGNGVGY